MSAISWNRTFPSSASTGGDVERDILSLQSSIALGLQPSFAWPGSGGGSAASAGDSIPGNLRMAHSGVVTGTYPNGFLSLKTQWASVWHIGSGWTGILGHSGMLDRGAGGSFPQTWKWLVQEGQLALTSSGTTFSVVFPTPYAVAPHIQCVLLQLPSNGAPRGFLSVVNGQVNTSGFSSMFSVLDVPSFSTSSIAWRSEGTVVA